MAADKRKERIKEIMDALTDMDEETLNLFLGFLHGIQAAASMEKIVKVSGKGVKVIVE